MTVMIFACTSLAFSPITIRLFVVPEPDPNTITSPSLIGGQEISPAKCTSNPICSKRFVNALAASPDRPAPARKILFADAIRSAAACTSSSFTIPAYFDNSSVIIFNFSASICSPPLQIHFVSLCGILLPYVVIIYHNTTFVNILIAFLWLYEVNKLLTALTNLFSCCKIKL